MGYGSESNAVAYLRNEFESVVAEFIVIAIEEGARYSAEWCIFFDLRLTSHHVTSY